MPSLQLFQQRFGRLDVARVKSLREPAIDGRKEVTGFAAPALCAPELSQADRYPQFEQLRSLLPRDRERTMIAALGFFAIPLGIEGIAAQPVHLGLAVALIGRLDD